MFIDFIRYTIYTCQTCIHLWHTVLGKPLEDDELHIILEYPAGSQLGNYSANRANRSECTLNIELAELKCELYTELSIFRQ